MSSPVLDIRSKGLIRIIRAVYRGASHLEFAFYLSPSKYKKAKPYLMESVRFREERSGKLVLRTRYYNIFVYRS